VGEVVVGESKDFSGEPNQIMREINIFIGNLKNEIEIPIILEPEFLSSREADKMAPKFDMARGVKSRIEKRGIKKVALDASSATIILQSYLDRKRA